MNRSPEVKKKWQEAVGNNQILEGKGFFISYNPDTSGGSHLTALGNILGAELSDGEETALVKRGDRNIYSILTGDWRKEYEALVPKGYKACKKFFDAHKAEHGNDWSTLEEDR